MSRKGVGMRAWVIMAVATIATPAIAAEQFDLACRSNDGKTEMRCRVDLDAGEYCFRTCDRILKIQESTSGMITFREEERRAPSYYHAYTRVNRLTGGWEWYNLDARYPGAQDVKGLCERRDFSGFGETNRKF